MPRYKTYYIRIKKLDDCVGRTVASTCSIYTTSFGFRFHDGGYFYCQYEDEGGGGEYAIDTEDYEPDLEEALALGIIDQAEFDRVEAEEEACRERRARLTYQRLKARFEGHPERSPNADGL